MSKRRATKKNHSSLGYRLLYLLIVIVVVGGGLYLTLPPSTAETEQPAVSVPKTVLDPTGFSGKIRQAYQIAEDNSGLLQQLDCFCGCANPAHSPYHRNLFDCFTDTHGANCQVCIEEALLAFQMSQGGATVEEIRQAILDRFG